LYYEPLDEEFEEAKYFTRDFENELFKKFKYNRKGANKRISSIEIK
jgi:hypothetical protein